MLTSGGPKHPAIPESVAVAAAAAVVVVVVAAAVVVVVAAVVAVVAVAAGGTDGRIANDPAASTSFRNRPELIDCCRYR